MSRDIVVVTGAAGFIGSNLVARIADTNTRVVACDHFRHESTWRYLRQSLLHDVIRPDELLPYVHRRADEIDAIVHMGAISATTETDLTKLIAANIRFSIDLWEASAAHDFRYVYASSAATYGDGTRGFTDDDSSEGLSRLQPLNPYGWSKHVVDRRVVEDVRQGRARPSCWAGLKFFNVYGPNEGHKGTMRSVVHQLYPLAAAGTAARLFKSENPDYPDGGQLRDFIHVNDCCAVVMNMLASPELSGIYNVGTGTPRSFADLATAVFAAIGSEPKIEFVPMPEALRARYQYFTKADTAKLVSHGLSPEFTSLEHGVADYVRTHLVHELSHTDEQ